MRDRGDAGGLIPPREGRVAPKAPGGEKHPFVAGLSPPGRSLTLASTLPSRGGMAPPLLLGLAILLAGFRLTQRN